MAQLLFSFIHISNLKIPLNAILVLLIGIISSIASLSEVSAGESSPANQNQALILKISESNYWLKLVHYKTRLLSSGYQSDITDPAFFLSAEGRQNPLLELIATLDSFQKDTQSVCRFPARYYWLSHHYGEKLQLEKGMLKDCAEYQKWKKLINPGSATLIFPAAYLNGPSSMFGHTLLRIEPADERADLPLITYAVNYAANVTDQDNNAIFAFKGIFGGYPGVMSIVPYHEKIKEYGEIENRDIWEYRLNLNQEEILQMMRHAWELKDLRSAYYFFDLNCSYLILNLLETGRDNINLTNQFRFKVIPIDTVRSVVDAGLVADIEYRAAVSTQLEQHYELLNSDQRVQLQKMLSEQVELSGVRSDIADNIDYARVLEVAYDALRYRALQTPAVRDKNAAYNLQLLQERSKVGVKEIWPTIKIPEDKPDRGHKSARVAAGMRHYSFDDESLNELVVKIRPAYHDLLDPGYGFPFGAQINFLDFTFSYQQEDHETNLNSVTIIDILSLTPMHELFDPLSWRVDFSYENFRVNDEDINLLMVSPGFGKSKFLVGKLLGYGLLNSSLEYSPDYNDEYSLGIGFQAGLLYSTEYYAAKLEIEKARFFAGEKDSRFLASLGVARHLGNNLSLRLSVRRENLYEQYINQYQMDINWYF